MPGKEAKEEITKLKAEIAALLSNKSSEADLKLANQKIEELEQKINRLVDKNSDVEKENERLLVVLRKFSDNRISAEQNAKDQAAKQSEIDTQKAVVDGVKSNLEKI